MLENTLNNKLSKKTVITLTVIIILLSLLSTFVGYSYKKVIKENVTLKTENTTLNKQLSSQYSFTVTKIPMSIDGKIVYKTVTKYLKKTSSLTESSHNSSVSIVTKTVTVTKKDFATFGLGTNFDSDFCGSVQRDFLSTPLGSFGVAVNPNFTYLKKSFIFLTYKP